MTRQTVTIICWICVIACGAFLRFDDLAKRPFHADEATGARLTARRMEDGGGKFDPRHHHGPLLAGLAIPLCEMRGETRWQTMSKGTLRTLPAIAGTLLILVPLLWRRRFGDGPMLATAAFIATSPLLVYYSRMFIHESLLVLSGMLAVISLTGKIRPAIPGILIALMFATKESFAISIIAWSAAGVLVAWDNRNSLDRTMLLSFWRENRTSFGISILAAAFTASFLYTDGFRHPRGAVDAVRTFFVYQTVEGHDKPFGYYFQLLAMPCKSGGVWWFGTPLVLLAVSAFAQSFRRSAEVVRSRPLVRFIAFAAAGHFAIYSIIAYKTPWLACLPWAHVCLLAGFAFVGFKHSGVFLKTSLAILTAICLATQFLQTRAATGRFASDERNPFAYVPTSGDVEKLEDWLVRLRANAPAGSLDPIAVIGGDYWPLPWYLRSFEKTGYWKTPPAEVRTLPLVFAMPETAETVSAALAGTHVSLPRGLRAGVPLQMFVRMDVWQHWMETENR